MRFLSVGAMKQLGGVGPCGLELKGFKVQCSGRLGGAEMARSEGYSEGSVPCIH